MLLCNHHHSKPLEESTYTPAILSPRQKSSSSSVLLLLNDKSNVKPSYQQWMELVQRLHNHTSSTKILREKLSPWHNEKLNSNKQVITLINHYSSILSSDNHEQLNSRLINRPKVFFVQ